MNRHGEAKDRLQYLEAISTGRKSGSKFSRAHSSNSLLQPSRPRGGLNPKALFSVAAMATAPVGTTVIEDQEEAEIKDDVESYYSENVAMEELSSKLAESEFDLDLCEQCTRRRRAKKQQQWQEQNLGSSLMMGMVGTKRDTKLYWNTQAQILPFRISQKRTFRLQMSI